MGALHTVRAVMPTHAQDAHARTRGALLDANTRARSATFDGGPTRGALRGVARGVVAARPSARARGHSGVVRRRRMYVCVCARPHCACGLLKCTVRARDCNRQAGMRRQCARPRRARLRAHTRPCARLRAGIPGPCAWAPGMHHACAAATGRRGCAVCVCARAYGVLAHARTHARTPVRTPAGTRSGAAGATRGSLCRPVCVRVCECGCGCLWADGRACVCACVRAYACGWHTALHLRGRARICCVGTRA